MSNVIATPPLGPTFASVTCATCRSRLESSPRNAHGFPFIHEAPFVDDKGKRAGTLSRQELGHQYVFCSDGRYAVCALRAER